MSSSGKNRSSLTMRKRRDKRMSLAKRRMEALPSSPLVPCSPVIHKMRVITQVSKIIKSTKRRSKTNQASRKQFNFCLKGAESDHEFHGEVRAKDLLRDEEHGVRFGDHVLMKRFLLYHIIYGDFCVSPTLAAMLRLCSGRCQSPSRWHRLRSPRWSRFQTSALHLLKIREKLPHVARDALEAAALLVEVLHIVALLLYQLCPNGLSHSFQRSRFSACFMSAEFWKTA